MSLIVRRAAAVVILAVGAGTPAAGQIVSSTFGPGDSYHPTLGWAAYNVPYVPWGGSPTGAIAVAFVAGFSGELSTIRIPVFGIDPSGGFVLSLFAGSDVTSGSLVESFAGNASWPGSIQTFVSAAHPLVSAGDTYWLALTTAPGTYGDYDWGASNVTSTVPPMEWRSMWSGDTWQPYGPVQTGGFPVQLPAYEVTLNPLVTATPEPGSSALVGGGMFTLLVAARRRQRAER